MLLEGGVDLLQVGGVRAFGEDALFREHREQSLRGATDQIHNALIVVVRDRLRGDSLGLVHLVDGLEEHTHKESLQLLVGEIDAQLLERVDCKHLKPKDVHVSNVRPHRAIRDETRTIIAVGKCRVDLEHDPTEEERIQLLGERMAHLTRLAHRVARRHPITSSLEPPGRHARTEVLRLASEQPAGLLDRIGVVEGSGVSLAERYIAQMEDRKQQSKDTGALRRLNPHLLATQSEVAEGGCAEGAGTADDSMALIFVATWPRGAAEGRQPEGTGPMVLLPLLPPTSHHHLVTPNYDYQQSSILPTRGIPPPWRPAFSGRGWRCAPGCALGRRQCRSS